MTDTNGVLAQQAFSPKDLVAGNDKPNVIAMNVQGVNSYGFLIYFPFVDGAVNCDLTALTKAAIEDARLPQLDNYTIGYGISINGSISDIMLYDKDGVSLTAEVSQNLEPESHLFTAYAIEAPEAVGVMRWFEGCDPLYLPTAECVATEQLSSSL